MNGSARSLTRGVAFAAPPNPHSAGESGPTTAASSDPPPPAGDDNGTDDLPRLPPVDPSSTEKVPTLKFGETLRFDEMGPIILNTDGTTRRIDNWNDMTQQEKEVAWRRIKKRNAERRDKLLLLEEQKQQWQTDDKETEL